MATSGSVRSEERRTALLAMLGAQGAIQLDDAAAALDVSAMTVRRDLDELEAEGLLRRVRGGAVSIVGPRPFDERRAVRARAKQTIAAKAAPLIPDTGAIAIDASTTAGTLAGRLGTRSGLVVATNSYDNFVAAGATPGVSAVLIGGEAEATTGSLVGPLACRMAGAMLYARAFASAAALHPERGTSEVSLSEAEVKRALAANARELVLCIDSSKLGQESVAHAFELALAGILITELDPADARLDPYRDRVELL